MIAADGENGQGIEDGYIFGLPELTKAGTYNVAAEYAETRTDLLAG